MVASNEARISPSGQGVPIGEAPTRPALRVPLEILRRYGKLKLKLGRIGRDAPGSKVDTG